MVEDSFLGLDVELVLLDDLLVVVDALLQHVIVRGQMRVHQAN